VSEKCFGKDRDTTVQKADTFGRVLASFYGEKQAGIVIAKVRSHRNEHLKTMITLPAFLFMMTSLVTTVWWACKSEIQS
jgi:hypothetical protein